MVPNAITVRTAKLPDVNVVEAPNHPSEKSIYTTTNPNLCKRNPSASSERTAVSMLLVIYPAKGIEVSYIDPEIVENVAYVYQVVQTINVEAEVDVRVSPNYVYMALTTSEPPSSVFSSTDVRNVLSFL